MTVYVPGTGETDSKKQNMSLQALGAAQAVDEANIATNTTNIATNTAAIAALPAVTTKAIQQAATSNTNYVTPLHQQDHDSAAKAWCLFSGTATGTNAPTVGYNVTSVTRNGAGDYTVNFTTAFATANYVCIANSVNSANNTFMEINGATPPTVSAIHLFAINSFAGAVVDPVSVMVVCYGRQ